MTKSLLLNREGQNILIYDSDASRDSILRNGCKDVGIFVSRKIRLGEISEDPFCILK